MSDIFNLERQENYRNVPCVGVVTDNKARRYNTAQYFLVQQDQMKNKGLGWRRNKLLKN